MGKQVKGVRKRERLNARTNRNAKEIFKREGELHFPT